MKYIPIFLIAFTTLLYRAAADLIFIDTAENTSSFKKEVYFVCEYYGINISPIYVDKNLKSLSLLKVINNENTGAIIITENALPFINQIIPKESISKKKEFKIPIFIGGLTCKTDNSIIQQWSNNTIQKIVGNMNFKRNSNYEFSQLKLINRELSGLIVPIANQIDPARYCFKIKNENIKYIIAMNTDVNKTYPTFVITNMNGIEFLFCVYNSFSNDSLEKIKSYDNKYYLFEIAPLLLFVRYAFGEKCWHGPNDYADFIIDDPWLLEKYGNLHYKELLEEMKKEGFHTTIGFPAWNFDRNESGIINLFKENEKYYSICIHGNNHDHREFNKYDEVSIGIQESNIRQSVARMEKMKDITGLSYDRVMVFPHGIAPAKTLGLLKKYNFLATFNSTNIPLGEDFPNNPADFFMSEVTTKYENFPGVKRYGLLNGEHFQLSWVVCVDLFLDNPIIFYSHPVFFKNSISEFNAIAQFVNNTQPDIRWVGLGDIARHLYRQKQRDDFNYDVQSYSSNIRIENDKKYPVTYHIRKEEDFKIPIIKITSNGKSIGYDSSINDISITIKIPPYTKNDIQIIYDSNCSFDKIDISKNNIRANILRHISDFRDITLSNYYFGRVIVDTYYNHKGLFIFIFLIFIITTFGIITIRIRK